MKGPQSEQEALILALQLAINAPDEQKAQLAADCAERLAAGMSEQEIKACKALAKTSLDL